MIYSYRRVSTDEQHNGPQAQWDAIGRWYDSQTDLPGREDFFDNGVSGAVPFAERPEGGRLVARIEQDQEPPTIVVSKLDRLFRSVADAATTLGHWNKIGVKLVAISEGFDMTNPYGRAMAQMASVFAELEREMIRSRTSDALSAMRLRGECIGGLPYGWILKPDGNHVAPCELEQEQIQRMKDLRSRGWSYENIAASLNVNGVPTKIAGGTWRSTQVRRILNREAKSADNVVAHNSA